MSVWYEPVDLRCSHYGSAGAVWSIRPGFRLMSGLLSMQTAKFDYELPPHFIAQQPAEPRDASRLLVLHRADGRIEHRQFSEIGHYLHRGDLLIANDSRVIPARLFGQKPSGGAVELLLLRSLDDSGMRWECMTRGRNIVGGTTISLLAQNEEQGSPNRADNQSLVATVEDILPSGLRIVRFDKPVRPVLDDLGEIPLPPYITEYAGNRERYQTVYSRAEGSVAAPTAGLHFTGELLIELRQQGVNFDTVTLHVGLDTFQPVTVDRIEDHPIHSEWAELSRDVAHRINNVALQGGRVVAVGTTAVRTLEWAATAAQGIDPYDTDACPWRRTAAFAGSVDLFIRPGYRFRAVDALITNFHLPKSTLLMLVSAFVAQAHEDDLDAGRRLLLTAYEDAKRHGYRFFSFGDAMLIL